MEWKGVYPALTTKFTPNDELDFEAFSLPNGEDSK